MNDQKCFLYKRLCKELKKFARMGTVSEVKHRSIMREVKELYLHLTHEEKDELSFYYLIYCKNVEVK